MLEWHHSSHDNLVEMCYRVCPWAKSHVQHTKLVQSYFHMETTSLSILFCDECFISRFLIPCTPSENHVCLQSEAEELVWLPDNAEAMIYGNVSEDGSDVQGNDRTLCRWLKYAYSKLFMNCTTMRISDHDDVLTVLHGARSKSTKPWVEMTTSWGSEASPGTASKFALSMASLVLHC